MRCSRCGRRGSIRKVARSPQSKLVFDWCQDCLDEQDLNALGIIYKVRDAPVLSAPDARSGDLARLIQKRSQGVVVFAFLFGMFGVLISLLGLLQGISHAPLDLGRSPEGSMRARLFTTAGAAVVGLALAISLGTVPPDQRRSMALHLIRGGFLALGFSLLLIGFVQNWASDPLRISCQASSAFALAWSAHYLEGRIRIHQLDVSDWLEKLNVIRFDPPVE